jgi:putative tricarboxylic transport membrane protein
MNRNISRRAAMLGGAALLAAPTAARAQTAFPDKPIRTIVPIAPGGQTDVLARLLQGVIDRLKLLPQPLVVVNNAAAGGSTGTRAVRDAAPDGYTIGMFHMGLLTAPAMGVVDYGHDAFEMVAQVGRTPVGLGVTASSRFKTIQDVVAEAKAKPDTLTVAMNIGLLPHFVPLMFQQEAGVRFRFVQAGGGALRLRSLLGGHTEVSLFAASEFVLFREQGIRPLMMFSDQRVADLPDVPTAKELGWRTVFEERVMAFAPKGAPRDRLDVIASALQRASADAEAAERFRALGIERQFIDGPGLARLLDELKSPLAAVADAVRKAQSEQKQ